jgi:hypothetical protein
VESNVVVEPEVIEETIEAVQPIQPQSEESDQIKEREDLYREDVYNEIDLEFTEIKNLVSEIKQARDEELQKLEELQLKESEMTDEVEDFADLMGIDEIELPDLDESNDDFNEVTKVQLQYDIGRSGKKYTAEELETLIKE